MANPQPYFLTGSSVVLRLVMTLLNRVCRGTSVFVGRLKVVMGTTAGLALTYGVYQTLVGGNQYIKRAKGEAPADPSPNVQQQPFEDNSRHGLTPRPEDALYLDLAASARCQPCVISHDKAHALFMWIRLKNEADPQEVACKIARLQQYVQEVEAPTIACCGNRQIHAGVGFGPEFYKQVKGGAPQQFTNAKHSLISGDSVGGDILVHAKSNKVELLKSLSKAIVQSFPPNAILSHEETYGQHSHPEVAKKTQSGGEPLSILNYQYTKGEMELFPMDAPVDKEKPGLLFVEDTGSQDTEPKRRQAAVDPKTGGSYVMTQRWVHDIKLLDSNGDSAMNDWVDKAWEECAGPPGERKFKSLMVLGAELANLSMDKWMGDAYKECLAIQKNHPHEQIICTRGSPLPHIPFRILRQSLPYKNQGGESGLFFVSYASTPKYNELLLDRLIASACGGGRLNSACQNVFRLSRNVRSACWYFPGVHELRELE
ncbi:hypothetical protein V1264_010301 [Littorina saxatilis]|uniref:Dyp-type peroxidase C-terminal domain-containing protein n=1 Tax=Littorina saxatilis TaxID=31220 RepID=A0AAN9APA6_9CAEN